MSTLTIPQTEILTALTTMFPEILTTGCIQRKQISEFVKAGNKWPTFITNQESISRGVYPIPGSSNSHPKKSTVHTVITSSDTRSEMVINNDIQNVIPMAKTHNITVASTPVHVVHSETPIYDSSSLIPDVDPLYVPFGNFGDLEKIVKSKMFYPVYLTGPSGNGKSQSIEQICAKNKRPMIRVNFSGQTSEEDLIGSKTLVDGNIEIIEGPLLIAMRIGAIVLLDEIDAGNPNLVMGSLQSILEKGRYYFKLKNEMIHATPGFNIIATANTKGRGSDDGKYVGTFIQNEAFLERFAVTFNQEYPSASIEKKIVMNLMEQYGCVNESFAETLVKWTDTIRRTYDAGGIDEIITTRRLTHIVRAYSIFRKEKKAIELACNRFDDMVRTAFVDLFDKMTTGANMDEETVNADV